ncbi:type II toxin-antitoxin system ribonuclease VapC1 [soil metagenome]
MIVIDGSALVIGVADTTSRGRHVRSMLGDDAVAPHLVDAEVGQAVRGLVIRGALDAEEAARSMLAAQALVTERFPHVPLVGRAWSLRDNLSFYDALYVALAELLRVPLVTADARLAGAHGPNCDIELI